MSTDTHPMHTRAPMLGGPAGSNAASRHYRVFISYSHADAKWANWLMRRLEGYRVPARLHGRAAPIGQVGPRIAPVFRDRDELPTTSDLGETIRTALRESATLVVVCSPASAKSHWVHQEILEFKRLGGGQRVFAFIVDGEPKNDGAIDDCFSPALRSALGPNGQLSSTPAEHVAADARPQGDGKEDAFVRLVAGLLGVGFDELRRRELQRRYRRLTFIAAGSVLGMTITLWLAAAARIARNDAQRRLEQGEDLVAFMLGDLHTQLDKIGRLEVLEAVPEKAMNYFAGLNARDLTDESLLRQAQALRQIGEIRVAQTRYPEAMRAFLTAYARAITLIERHPQDGKILFERGQAEYWIGAVHRKRGEPAGMTEWWTRYRDTGLALVALDAANPEWQRELVYGLHNLAVADVDTGRLDAARRGFLAEIEALGRMRETGAAELRRQFDIVQAGSWLGTIAERSGDFKEAAARFAEQVSQLEAIARADPKNARWRQRLADALSLRASVLAIQGERAASMAARVRAKSLMDALVADDPKNRFWLRASLFLRLKEAELVWNEGDPAAAAALVDDVRQKLESLTAASPKDPELAGRIAVAWRLLAELSFILGRADAPEAAAKAVEGTEKILAEAGANAEEKFVGECAQARVVAGRVAGDSSAAAVHWRRARELVAARCATTSNWRILLPAAQVFWCLGENDAAREVIRRLQAFGFHPLQPWPDGGAPILSETTMQKSKIK